MSREQFIRVDGLNVRYFALGEGAPVLLLHGASLGSSADVWASNLPALAARGFRAVAFDQPGFGASDNPADASLGYRRSFVPAFMDVLGIARAALIGHSQSGRIAVDLAFSHAGRVAAVVVLGTGSLLPPLPGSEAAGEGEEGGASEPTLEETRAALEATLFHVELATPEAVELRHRMSLGKNFLAFRARKAAGRGKGAGGSVPLWQRVHESPVPLLMLYGREDRGDAAQRAARLHSGIEVHVLPQCKHLVQWDAAERFVDLTARFLASSG